MKVLKEIMGLSASENQFITMFSRFWHFKKLFKTRWMEKIKN
jgi:hypothetical protein